MNPRQLQRQSRVQWFEIPATDFARATRFYEQIFQVTLKKEQMGPQMLGVFSYEPPAISGCILAGPDVSPGNAGTIIYLNADPVLATVVDRVAAAGGTVLVPRVELPPGMGVFSHIIDTEGNKIGLHAIA
jgi:predicted enzyme related to lactoylglutathione lyase